MSKDPAFLFYSQDFFTGVATMTNEQVGKYIRLLCLQHQKGLLTEKEMLFICGSYDEDIFGKFQKNSDGLYYNIRLTEEIEKRKKHIQHQSENAKKRWNGNAMAYATALPLEDENENEIIYKDISRKGGMGEKPKWAENFKNFNPEIKYAFESEKFGSMWDYWLKYKKERKDKKYTTTGEQATIKGLFDKAEGSIEKAAEIINQSIQQNWAGLFEVRDHQNKSQVTDLAKTGRVLN